MPCQTTPATIQEDSIQHHATTCQVFIWLLPRCCHQETTKGIKVRRKTVGIPALTASPLFQCHHIVIHMALPKEAKHIITGRPPS